MNKNRKQRLQQISDKLQTISEELESIEQEEQEYLDNVPENMQSGERYEQSESAINYISDAKGYLEGVISSLSEVIEN